MTMGYAWILTDPYGEQPVLTPFNEHRIWQQFALQQKTGKLAFHHRYRLEQRYLESVKLLSNGAYEYDGYLLRHRARYRMMITMPLTQRESMSNSLFVVWSDEIFIGLGDGVIQNFFDQNRMYLGLGYRFNAMTNLQLGYLNQRILKLDRTRQENNHTLQVALTKNVDLSR